MPRAAEDQDLRNAEAKPQDAFDLLFADIDAENALDLGAAQRDRGALHLTGDGIDALAVSSPPAWQNQLGYAIAGQRRDAPIGAALEAVRRVGVHAVALGHAADRRRIEPRRLDQHVLRLLGDHGVEAAHHAGERDRLLGVGDDQVVGRELALDAVERLQDFAFARAAHDDRAAFQQVEIEGVRGMAELVDGVVGRVGGVVDGARAQQFQTLDDGLRRRADLHIANDARGVSRAALGVFDDDGEDPSAVIPTGAACFRRRSEGSAVPGSFGSTSSAQRRRWPMPRAPRRSGSWRRRGWWSGPSRRWLRRFLLDGLHRDAGRGQVFGELAIVGSDIDELAQP